MRELGARALNRALLDRQSLLRRQKLSATAMVERLVGLQAQAPVPPYFGLWSRLTDFRPEQLSRLLDSRAVVRIVLMRGTIHLVSAADCLFLRPLVQPALTRSLGSSSYSAQLAGLDPAELADVGRALLTAQPMSPAELGAAMARRWPDRDPLALANAVRSHVPLVQVPPRGLWGRSGAAHAGDPVAGCATGGRAVGGAVGPAVPGRVRARFGRGRAGVVRSDQARRDRGPATAATAGVPRRAWCRVV